MSNISFYVPELKNKGAWVDMRGLKGGHGWRSNIPLSYYKHVAIHHSVTNPQKNLNKEVEYIHYLHVSGRGWGGIGYNFIIGSEEKNGYAKVAYTGDLGSVRAHTPNMKGSYGITKGYGNMYIIGICIVGRFDGNHGHPTKAQLRSAHELVKELIFDEDNRMPNLANSWNTMKTHKYFDWTACAGDFEGYKGKIKNPPGTQPEPDNLYRVYDGVKQVGAFKNKDNAFDTWYNNKGQTVKYNNNDVTLQFKNMSNKLEKQISELKKEIDSKISKINNLDVKIKELEKTVNDLKPLKDKNEELEVDNDKLMRDNKALKGEVRKAYEARDKFLKSFWGQLYLLFNKPKDGQQN